MNSRNKRSSKNPLLKVRILEDRFKLLSRKKWRITILIPWLKHWLLLKKCWEMVPNKKLLKIVIEASVSRITINYQNGSLKIRKNIISRKSQLQKKSLPNKRKDWWLSTPEFLKRSWRLKSERKLECKRNLKRFKRKQKLSWIKMVLLK